MKRITVIPNYTKDYDMKYTKLLCEYLSGKAQAVMHIRDKADGILAEFCEDAYDNACGRFCV